MTTRILKTEAIVLRKKNILNKDKIVTFFTEELGKLNIFAHGVRKITSRRLPHLETGNLININAYKKNERYYLQETFLKSGFYKIKSEEKKHKHLYLFLFLLNKLLPEGQAEREVYKLTKLFMRDLSEQEFRQENLIRFLNSLLYYLGYTTYEEPYEKLIRTIEQIIDEKLPS